MEGCCQHWDSHLPHLSVHTGTWDSNLDLNRHHLLLNLLLHLLLQASQHLLRCRQTPGPMTLHSRQVQQLSKGHWRIKQLGTARIGQCATPWLVLCHAYMRGVVCLSMDMMNGQRVCATYALD